MHKKWILPIIALSMMVAFAGCSEDSGGSSGNNYKGETPPPIDPTESRGNISLTDTPMGYASLGKSYAISATNAKTVTTRDELRNAVKNGGVIIIDGMIDMSDGRLVAAGKKSTDSTPALDSFVKSNSSYATYSAWVEAYSKACELSTEDDKAGATDGTGNSSLQSVMKKMNDE